jgi:hypothetical protein
MSRFKRNLLSCANTLKTSCNHTHMNRLQMGWRLLPTAAGIQEPCDIAFYDVFTDGDIDIKTPCMVITMSDKTVHKDHATTVFDLSQRTYTKRRHPIEIAFLRFMLAYRGRFMPHGNYHLDFPNATHMGE